MERNDKMLPICLLKLKHGFIEKKKTFYTKRKIACALR